MAMRPWRQRAYLARSGGRWSMTIGNRILPITPATMRCAMPTTCANCALSTRSITRHGQRHGSTSRGDQSGGSRNASPCDGLSPPELLAFATRYDAVVQAALMPTRSRAHCRGRREKTRSQKQPPPVNLRSVFVTSKARCWRSCRTFACRLTITKGSGISGWSKSNRRSPEGFARWKVLSDSVAFAGIFPPPVSIPKMFLRPSGMRLREPFYPFPRNAVKADGIGPSTYQPPATSASPPAPVVEIAMIQS